MKRPAIDLGRPSVDDCNFFDARNFDHTNRSVANVVDVRVVDAHLFFLPARRVQGAATSSFFHFSCETKGHGVQCVSVCSCTAREHFGTVCDTTHIKHPYSCTRDDLLFFCTPLQVIGLVPRL